MSQPGSRVLSGIAFASLLLIAVLMGANHVAARVGFNHGLDVASAVVARSLVTASLLFVLIRFSAVSMRFDARQRRFVPLVGLLIGIQSLCLYSAVARIPVALALLAFNTYPLWTALADWLFYRRKPERATLIAMPMILVGLALALDVFGAASGLGAKAQWQQIGVGVAFATVAAAMFGGALVFTQHELSSLDPRVRTACTLALASVIALIAGSVNLFGSVHGGFGLPNSTTGWIGLALLTLLYGTGFTLMFTVLPKLGVAGNSAIMNVEPVFALTLAWLFLQQAIAPIQVVGALIVVATVVALGLRRGK
ncbi:MAG: DMT family transporter [Betaproteobacteria bacterium]|nr:MAG: DMT family transporter [Betaproteobacteria bacterium]